MDTSVALLIYRRPDKTRAVCQQILKAEPKRLYVIADGPQEQSPDERALCRQARLEVEKIDWDCQVVKQYAESNMGLKDRVASGLDWVFSLTDEAIVLEDDCIPSLSFFEFCEYILNKYREDERVAMASGHNPLGAWKPDRRSYHFSNFGGIWGWATWSSMWKMYHVGEAAQNSQEIRKVLKGALDSRVQVALRAKGIERALSGELASWDYQWFYARLLNHTVAAVPSRNLVVNVGIGEGEGGTHTTDKIRGVGGEELGELGTPFTDPIGLVPDAEFDQKWFDKVRGYSGNRVADLVRKAMVLLRDEAEIIRNRSVEALLNRRQ